MAFAVIQTCAACGQRNRVPVARLRDCPSCGTCKGALAAPDAPLQVGDADLPALLKESPVPVVVDFWAPWCGPCRALAPALASVAAEMRGQVLIAKVNVDDNPRSAQTYQARSIPMLIGFDKGLPVAQQVGAAPARQLRAWVEGLVGKAS